MRQPLWRYNLRGQTGKGAGIPQLMQFPHHDSHHTQRPCNQISKCVDPGIPTDLENQTDHN